MNEANERLMDLAEARIREAGYRGFSFRDLTAEIGIKSASVHHQFPTKADMTTAVVQRYGDLFFGAVAPQNDESGEDVIATHRMAFRSTIERDGRMCLNGMLGAEAGGIPDVVVREVGVFFRRCIKDLSRRIGGSDAATRVFNVMATREGGLILARAFSDIDAFDRATTGLLSQSPTAFTSNSSDMK